MKNADFNCTQQELYLICRIGWQNCLTYIEEFATFKALYTEQFIADRLNEVDLAESIPDEKSRYGKQKDDRYDMERLANNCLNMFQYLKQYIETAYPADRVKSKLETAGQSYYQRAQTYNRDALNNLNTTAISFITNNQVELKANQNMPADFLQNFITAKNAFSNAMTAYINCRLEVQDVTSASKNANSNIFNNVMLMFKDGQRLFLDNETLRKKFTFSNLLTIVSGVGVAGLRGYVTSGPTNLPVGGAIVTINDGNKATETDRFGYYEFLQLNNGEKYTVTVIAEGFDTYVNTQVDIKKSTFHMLRVNLHPVPVENGVLVMS